MQLVVDATGQVRCVYGEQIDLTMLGLPSIARASHVEPTVAGWTADLRPVGGGILGPFHRRSEALAAELAWLERHWLLRTDAHLQPKEGPPHD